MDQQSYVVDWQAIKINNKYAVMKKYDNGECVVEPYRFLSKDQAEYYIGGKLGGYGSYGGYSYM